MKISSIVILGISLLISMSSYAQTIKELEGECIIIPGRNPMELIYNRVALEKNSFKDKFHYQGNICNKPIHISHVYTINVDKPKAALIVEFEMGADSLILHFPLKIKIKERDKIYSDRNYYPRFTRNSLSYYDNYLTADKNEFRIPHYFCSDVEFIKNEVLGKSFYVKSGEYYVHTHYNNIIFENDSSYSITFNAGDSKAEQKKRIAKYRKGDGLAYLTTSGGDFKYFEDQYNTFDVSSFKKNSISQDSLIELVEQDKTSKFFFSIKDEYIGKEVHIDDINLDSYPRLSFSINDNKAITQITNGIYWVKDFKVMTFQEKAQDYPTASAYMIITPKDASNKAFAISISKKEFDDKVILIDDYKKKLDDLRIKLEKEEIERQKQEQAAEKTEHIRLVKKYGASNAQLIEDGAVRLGFTKSMVEESWGMPQNVTTITNFMGSIECWIYGLDSYIYFKGGKVVQIIN